MDHLTTSLAYVVEQKPKANVDTKEISELGLQKLPHDRHLLGPPCEGSRCGETHPFPFVRSLQQGGMGRHAARGTRRVPGDVFSGKLVGRAGLEPASQVPQTCASTNNASVPKS